MNKIKRFGTIYLKDMSREIEDTIINDGNQMKKLYEEIDYLKEELNKKNSRIKVLEEENKAHKLQIETLKILISKEKSEYNNFDIKSNNRDILPSPTISIEKKSEVNEFSISKNIVENVNNSNSKRLLDYNNYKKYINKNQIEKKQHMDKIKLKMKMFIAFLKFRKTNYYKNKIKIISIYEEPLQNSCTNSNVINKSNRNRRNNRNLHILERYKIIVYDDIGNSIVKQLIAKETELIICYKNDIADKIKKKVDNITISEVMDYIAKHENLSYKKKSTMKYLFERCEYLYINYGQYNKLNKFKFDIPSLAYMTRNEWTEWVLELDKLVKIHYPMENICQHIMGNNSKRAGEKCGKINCKNHNIS